MKLYASKKVAIFFLLLQTVYSFISSKSQFTDSCSFDKLDWRCKYSQSVTDNFNWSHVNVNHSHQMVADTTNRHHGSKAELKSSKISSENTHCFTFAVLVKDKVESNLAGNKTDNFPAVLLNVYVQDDKIGASRKSVWNSSKLKKNLWNSVELALAPRSYQVIFEAVALSSHPGYVAIDNVTVSSSSCDAAPHFLRLGDKAVNVGQNVTLQCLLSGHKALNALVVLQKSTGEVLQPTVIIKTDTHLSASFLFLHATASNAGVYRCVSDNTTQVGVSNYANLSVKVPPFPRFGPKVVSAGPTYLKIELNWKEFSGDGPIVQAILIYRPVNGSWQDVHEIGKLEKYDLWHLQPDTEYELAVTLVRPGIGGQGFPGPTLKKKTKCGAPRKPVENIRLDRVGNVAPVSMVVSWNAPDFSITQCHNYDVVVRYRPHTIPSSFPYEIVRVKDKNSVEISGLEAYTKYEFKVELANAAANGSIESGPYVALTSEALPGPVSLDSFIVTSDNETAITVIWDAPDKPNGNITKYTILHQAINTSDPTFHPQNDVGLFEVSGIERNLTLSPLHPGTEYRISIRATNSAGNGSIISLTGRTDIAPPTMPQYPPVTENNTDVVSTPTTIEITILPAQANGAPITGYYVVVVEDSPSPTRKSRPGKSKKNSKRGKGRKKKGKNRKERSLLPAWLLRYKRQAADDVKKTSECSEEPLTYKEATDRNQSYYAPANFLPDEVQKNVKFVVGDGSMRNGFENPPLDPNKNYKIYIRVESSTAEETTFNCQLVAIKSRVSPALSPPTTTPSFTTPLDGILGDPAVPVEEDNDDKNSTNTTGDKEATAQKQTLLYAAIGGTVGAIIIIIIIIVIFVVQRMKKRNRKEEVVNPFEVRLMMSDIQNPAHTLLPVGQSETDVDDRQALMPDLVGYEHQDFLDKNSDESAARGGYAATSNDERFAVRVDDFHVHVSEMKAAGGYGFRDEFSSFSDGPTAPWTVAASTLNRNKNRYGNVLAYDHSRVVLEFPPGHEGEFQSDYINASYINGYKRPSMYIATQAPSPNTFSDFWWMVWQEKSNVIVMVTNLVEMGRVKCEKYWPDDRAVFGAIDVSLNSEVELSDYVVRTFVLQQTGGYDVREVKQFHFTAWPDHGVPSRPTNLLTFLRKIKSFEPQGQGPTVVHCSAGAGRTGCFIVIDMMLDMARDEDIVDIHNTVRDLRSKRVNMVQTEEQYVFIHEAVLEALLCGETLVPASELVRHYDELITVDPQTHFAPIQEEFETLNVITPKLAEEECTVARLPRNRNKNRFMDVLPADRHLAHLVTSDPQDRDNTYINSVFLDSYFRSNSFLVTQMPLPGTVMDIWRLIYDHRCTSIVMMNDVSEHDQTCAQYWPDRGSIIIGPFTVELLTKDDEVDVVCRLFKLQNVTKPGETYRLVQHFQVTNWPAAQPVPYSRNSVLRVIQLVMKWQSECARTDDPGKTLVHCVAGAGRSGTFVSCFNMCEQLRHEYAVDIFNIVQRLRNVRPQLVETLEQYRFCYEVGIEFVER